MLKQPPTHRLDLRVREFAQLFNSMDPAPFLNKDLDREAEAFIENWALALSPRSHLHITVHLGNVPEEANPESLLGSAIRNFFKYKSGLVKQELRLLLRQGRLSLLIGLVFVAICLLAAESISRQGAGPAFTIGRESLTIVGWVAMWRPLQIFLYDWWPLARRLRVYAALRRATIHVVPAK